MWSFLGGRLSLTMQVHNDVTIGLSSLVYM